MAPGHPSAQMRPLGFRHRKLGLAFYIEGASTTWLTRVVHVGDRLVVGGGSVGDGSLNKQL